MSETPETNEFMENTDGTQSDFKQFAGILEVQRNDYQNDFYSALKLIQRIREAAGDPEGKLMHNELVDHIRNLRKKANEQTSEKE